MNKRTRPRSVSTERADRFLTILEALEGKPCPTDAELSFLMGGTNSSSASALMHHLRETGQIRNIGTKSNRQLLIVRSGKKTATARGEP